MRALLLLAFVALAGCSLIQGEGSESLVVANLEAAPLVVSLRIIQDAGGIVIFSENVPLNAGQTRTAALAMAPGSHTVDVTTSTSVQERLLLDIPEKGDSVIEVIVQRGGARINLRTTT